MDDWRGIYIVLVQYFSVLIFSFVYRCSRNLATLFGKLNVLTFLYFKNIVFFLILENSCKIWFSFKMSKNSPRCMISLSQRKVWGESFCMVGCAESAEIWFGNSQTCPQQASL